MSAHGTYVAYVNGCHCDDCRRANREYERERTKRNAVGRSYFVPAEPVRERWLQLRSIGMSDDEIERVAGLGNKVSVHLFGGHWRTGEPVKRIKRTTAERILAVRTRAVKPRTHIPSGPSQDRVLDLMEMGYSQLWVADRLGVSRSNFRIFAQAYVTVATHARIRALWESTTTARPVTTRHEQTAATRARRQAARLRRRPTRDPNPSTPVDTDTLRSLMAQRGMSAVDLSQAAGREASQVAAVLHRGSCSETTLCAIASALGVREDALR